MRTATRFSQITLDRFCCFVEGLPTAAAGSYGSSGYHRPPCYRDAVFEESPDDYDHILDQDQDQDCSTEEEDDKTK